MAVDPLIGLRDVDKRKEKPDRYPRVPRLRAACAGR